jgi:hypothetical protein
MKIPPCFSTPEASRNLTPFSQIAAARMRCRSAQPEKRRE